MILMSQECMSGLILHSATRGSLAHRYKVVHCHSRGSCDTYVTGVDVRADSPLCHQRESCTQV